MRTIWVVRAGVANSLADAFERKSLIGLTVPFRNDASDASTADIRAALEASHPSQAQYMAALLRRLVDELEVGDLVVTPSGGGRPMLVGEVGGTYTYEPQPKIHGLHHQRATTWLGSVGWEDLPVVLRRAVGSPMPLYRPAAQDLLSAFLTRRGLGGGS